MDTFPEWFEGYVPQEQGDWGDWETPASLVDQIVQGPQKKITQVLPPEVDEATGLPLATQETTESLYGITLHTNSDFGLSLTEWFENKGFLTPNQVRAWKKNNTF